MFSTATPLLIETLERERQREERAAETKSESNRGKAYMSAVVIFVRPIAKA
jgi:CHASE3 domain sensor protein